MSFPRYQAYSDSAVEWLGIVPAHWKIQPLKRVTAAIESGTSVNSVDVPADDGEFGVLKTSCVYRGYFEPGENKRVVDEDCVRVSCPVKRGHLIVSRMNTPQLVGAAGLVQDTVANLYLPDRLWQVRIDGAAAKFVYWWTQSAMYREQVQSAATGTSASMKNIAQDQFLSLSIPLPSSNEQQEIAEFLDRETAKIDALVAEQRRLMDLLREKRQAVISHAVTKGLNPDAPMKDSGVEWMGAVPAHWAVMPLARATIDRCDGPFGSGLKSEHYTESGVRVIRLQNIKRAGFDGSDEAFIAPDYYAKSLGGHDVAAGDLLIAGLGDDNNVVGRACVAPAGIEPAMVKADCFRFRLDARLAVAHFVAHQLNSSASADAGWLSTGTTRSRISLSAMGTRRIALPPRVEQETIVSFIADHVAEAAKLGEQIVRAAKLLEDRRAALVTAAVTGQIDVRGLAAAEAA